MGKKADIFGFVRNYAENKGIISLDVGTIQEDTGSWKTVQSFCNSSVAWIHSLVSKKFLDAYGGMQPINYLYEYWKDSQKEDETIIYSFAQEGFIDDNRREFLVREEKGRSFNNYSLKELSNNPHDLKGEDKNKVSESLEEIIKQHTLIDEQLDGEDSFKNYQVIFTRLILASFNSILDQDDRIKYVTIVLLRKKYDGKWHLSYNAAIFSNNLSYLENPSINLMFNCISHENYDNEIALLKQNVRRESIKSAMSAIMSRNMSHNLGSHFISNTKNYFSVLIEKEPNNEANYRGIKHALQYIQERMDFIATITSTDTYPFGAVNAKAQIFDELAPDDFYYRHGKKKAYNFLMDYLVLSEKISKQSWNRDGDKAILSEGEHKLVLQMGHWDGDLSKAIIYWNSKESSDVENQNRDDLLAINFAIPGGILGRHAIFSILENIIRNAAKHGQDKIQEKNFIVRMLYRTDIKRLIIFDNKKDPDIRLTINSLNEKLKNLHFLSDTGALAQENKGLKEMLICAIWLQNKNVAQVISENDTKSKSLETEEEKKRKLEVFGEYLKVIAVDANGVELEDNKTIGYLGYSIKLDLFEKVHYIQSEPSLEDLKGIKADIICANKDYLVEQENVKKFLSQIFPRFIIKNGEQTPEEMLEAIVAKNCGEDAVKSKMIVSYATKYRYESDVMLYDDWKAYSFIESRPSYEDLKRIMADADIICANDDYEVEDNKITKHLSQIIPSFRLKIEKNPNLFEEIKKSVNENRNKTKDKNGFLFKEHVNDKWKIFEALYQSPGIRNQYVDSISGGDFTYTLIQPSFINDYYNLLKVKESVATRFVIIDERIFEHYKPMVTMDYSKSESIKKGKNIIESENSGEVLVEKMASFVFKTKQAIGNGIYNGHEREFKDFVNDKELLSSFLEKDLEQHFLERRGIYLFNIEADKNGFNLLDISSKNTRFEWNDGFGKENRYFDGSKKTTTFLSIHLGLIDKIREQLLKKGADEKIVDSTIVETLENFFGAKFVSIHSGRGGLDIRESLRQYTFQSFSAIENPLYNSKFLISQQFYNLSYYGTTSN